jgi:hypothetical protein
MLLIVRTLIYASVMLTTLCQKMIQYNQNNVLRVKIILEAMCKYCSMYSLITDFAKGSVSEQPGRPC